MENQGIRRFRRQGKSNNQTLLPLRSSTLSNTVSCWYCDLKICSFNEPIYHLGEKYARFWRVWFSMGIGFCLSVVFGVAAILVAESVATLFLPHQSNKLTELISSQLFGFNPAAFGSNFSLLDFGLLLVSTMFSVAVHEFGHAVAAASEGIQLEYIAIFLAVLFPGAVVAFSFELLQAKSRLTALRIYCAGIWHNALCCAACGLALLLLPLIMSPFYVYGERPMVLGVSSTSPLSSYLSPGDIIMSVDGMQIHNVHDWIEVATSLEKQTLASSNYMNDFLTVDKSRIYCAPISLVQNSESMFIRTNKSTCPNELIGFVSVPCFALNAHSSGSARYDIQEIANNGHCFSSSDIIQLTSCQSLGPAADTARHCICSEDELCVSPVQIPGIAWAEIIYQSSDSSRCMKLGNKRNTSAQSSDVQNCQNTFLYVGDAISMARSVRLTSFQPRVTFTLAAYLPDMFEKFLVQTYQISVALALLNSLPVYFLDGESILEVCFFYITFLGPGKRRLLLQICLVGGSVMTSIVFWRIFITKFW